MENIDFSSTSPDDATRPNFENLGLDIKEYLENLEAENKKTSK
jgi:hypothetical protein